MEKERKYPLGYRPTVVTANFTLKFYDKKYHNYLIKKATKPKFKHHIKSVRIENQIIVIDGNCEIPTEKMVLKEAKKVWKTHGIKSKDINQYKLAIREIEVILRHGCVNYDFDEFKH